MAAEGRVRKRRVDVEEAVPVEGLKAALWYGVAKIVEEEELAMQRTSNHDGAIESQASASEAFVAALVELLWAQLEVLATDVEAFAKHAGRKRIQPEDVLLVARRNKPLHTMLTEHLEKSGNAPPGGIKPDAKRTNPDFEGEDVDMLDESLVAAGPSKPAKARAKPVLSKKASAAGLKKKA